MSIHIQEWVRKAAKYKVKDGLPPDILGRREFINLCKEAQCFDFGDVNSEIMPQGTYFMDITCYPAPICWYELSIANDRIMVLLDTRSNRHLLVQYFYDKHTFGYWWLLEYQTSTVFIYSPDKHTIPEMATPEMKIFFELPLFLSAIISSRDVTVSDKILIPRKHEVSSKLRNDIPRFDYRTVAIKPERIINAKATISYPESEPAYSQRYHFRIGHWRHLSNGSKVAVKGYWAGNIGLGVVEKDYDCRGLAKRDLFGEVPTLRGPDLFA